MTSNLTKYEKICHKFNAMPFDFLTKQLDSDNINLSGYFLGEKDIGCFLSAYTGELKTLIISENELPPSTLKKIAEVINNKTFLTLIDLEKCGIQAQFGILLKSMMSLNLEDVNISGNVLSRGDIILLADLIRTQTHLVKLDLSDTRIDGEGMRLLAHQLSKNTTIQNLNLSWNRISDEGGVEIANMLKTNRTMTILDLSMNGLCIQSCKALAKNLPMNDSLEYFNLSDNHINKISLNFLLNGLYNNASVGKLFLTGNPMDLECPIMIARMLLKSKRSVLTRIEIKNSVVDHEFEGLYEEIKKTRDILISYDRKSFGKLIELKETGGIVDGDPTLILAEYMKQKNLRPIDFFKLPNGDKAETITWKNIPKILNLMDL